MKINIRTMDAKKSVHDLDAKSNHSSVFTASKCTKCIPIPLYGVVLMSLAIGIMFIAICCLSYLLYRTRYKKIGVPLFINSDSVVSNEYVRQTSSEITESVPLKKISAFESPFKQSDILSMVDADVKEPSNKPQTPKPLKLDYKKPANSTKLPIQSVITPDQMNKVCVEVLSKIKRNQSTSLTHLNELMNSKNNEEETTRGHYQLENDLEEYDALPSPRQLGTSNDETYDCPQIGTNHNDSDDPQDYYDNLPVREDMYQNARFVHRML